MSASSCPSCKGAPPRPGHLLCLACWREVPATVQRLVHRTWKAYSALIRSDDHDAMFAARREYLAASEQATNAARTSRFGT